MVRDSVSELINGMKMASKAKKPLMVVSASKLIKATLEALKKEGYVASISEKGKDAKKFLEVTLNMDKPVVGAQRISSFSKRVYKGANEILVGSRIKGVHILTTPKGVLSSRDAKKEKVGGEVLFKIW